MAWLLLAGMAGVTLDAAKEARADTLDVVNAKMPTAREAASAVWTGTYAFNFGGFDGSYLNEIVRYDPVADQVTVTGALFPSARSATSAVWTGTYAFVFGGVDGNLNRLDQIIRYDPATDQATVMEAKLPTKLDASGAVWTGAEAIIFGGNKAPGDRVDTIVRYDPATDTAVTAQAKLPSPRNSVQGVWDGTYAYLFGGEVVGATMTDEILRYDPAADTLQVMPSRLPFPLGRPHTAWDGQRGFMFGGYRSGVQASDAILTYNPATDTIAQLDLTLPTPRVTSSAVWANGVAYVFAGAQLSPTVRVRDILRYDPRGLDPPLEFTATAGPAMDAVTLAWQAPIDTSTVTGYRIYRGDAPGAHALLAEVAVGVQTYVDAGLPPLRTFYYIVTATDGTEESRPAVEQCSAGYPWQMLPSTQPACAAPPGWDDVLSIDQSVPIVADVLDRDTLATIDGRPDPADPTRYLLDVTVLDGPLPTIGFYTAGLVQAPVHLTVPNALQADNLQVRVSHRSDPSNHVCLVSVGVACVADAPLRPDDAGWLLREGPKAEVVLELSTQGGGGPSSSQWLRIPFAGQFLSAQSIPPDLDDVHFP